MQRRAWRDLGIKQECGCGAVVCAICEYPADCLYFPSWTSVWPTQGITWVHLYWIVHTIIQAFCDCCNILFISPSTYYRYLKKVLYPVIWCYWLMHQAATLADIMVLLISCQIVRRLKYIFYLKKTGAGVILCGDGRFDSPGFSAKYCTYFIQAIYDI